jgi:hypothetical protein
MGAIHDASDGIRLNSKDSPMYLNSLSAKKYNI